MYRKFLFPFAWIAGFTLIIGLACNASASTTPAAATQPPVVKSAEPQVAAPQETVEQQPASGAVSSLQGVKNAVIQIESQGTFVDPEFGLITNGAGRGSGFIIDPSGIAVTNNHVVTGAALLKVWVGGESEPRNARVLGVSECSDLAVIDIDGEGYDYLDWFENPIEVGMDMYIAGFPLGDPEFTLTKGVVSKARTSGESSWASVDSVVEYDATSNPGNSGGPVVTSDGKVIAVHYAGNASTRQAFGISRDTAKGIIDQLRSGRDIDTIGVNGQAVGTEDGSLTGVWVSSVQSGSPADRAGIKPGDILTQMENLVLATNGTMTEYCDILRSHQPGDTLGVQVLRWDTGDLFEGQLNGRELELSGNAIASNSGDMDQPQGDGENGDYVDPYASLPGDPYFYTEFDGGLGDWSYFLTNGQDDGFDIQTVDSQLRFDISDTNTWVYLVYDAYEYTDVRIDTLATNLGRNNNNVSLICRESEDGWYEFNIANNGKYDIFWFDDVSQHDYVLLYSGGSTAIRMGKDTNQYTAICNGEKLTLLINDVEVRTVTDKNLKSGRTGLSVSSFNVTPITVEFDYLALTVP